MLQVALKSFYFVYSLIGGRAADKLNDMLLADWINHLPVTQIAPAVVKRQGAA